MLNFRLSLTSSRACAGVLLFLALTYPGRGRAEILDVDIHDGQPWNPLYGQSQIYVAGNFFPMVEVTGGFWIHHMWFYHGGNDYASSGVPYEIHIMERVFRQNGDVDFDWIQDVSRETTCNFCWEDVLIETYVYGNLNEDRTLGVFFRPLGGYAANQTPRIWVDRSVNWIHAAATLAYSEPTEYSFPEYFSDYGIGEVMLGAELEGDIVVPTGETSFSAIKSLY